MLCTWTWWQISWGRDPTLIFQTASGLSCVFGHGAVKYFKKGHTSNGTINDPSFVLSFPRPWHDCVTWRVTVRKRHRQQQQLEAAEHDSAFIATSLAPLLPASATSGEEHKVYSTRSWIQQLFMDTIETILALGGNKEIDRLSFRLDEGSAARYGRQCIQICFSEKKTFRTETFIVCHLYKPNHS